VEVAIYSTPQNFVMALTSGTTFDGVWSVPEVISLRPGRHTFLFQIRDGSNTITNVLKTASVIGGSVQVVGTPLNYPNPFAPSSGGTTRIQYSLSADAPVTLIIYDITGHEVKRFKFASGTEGGRADLNSVIWNGRNLFNRIAANGMYMYKVISRDNVIGDGKLVIFDR
jgi:hypothetical protein